MRFYIINESPGIVAFAVADQPISNYESLSTAVQTWMLGISSCVGRKQPFLLAVGIDSLSIVTLRPFTSRTFSQ
jgi:hypothetical protein